MDSSSYQLQAVPAYFHPDDSADDWSRLATTSGVALVVANVSDGPGIVREEQWAAAFRGARAAGADIVGYVDTGYFGRTGLRTRLGSTSIEDWIEQILHDMTSWCRLYRDCVTGIFFDQVAESDDGASVAPLLRQLREHAHRLVPKAITVLNPGVDVPPAFADVADILVTFEGPCDAYLGTGPHTGFAPLSWQPGPELMIWHIVHHVPDSRRAAQVVALSRQRGAGMLYVTDGSGANPYSSLPLDEIWAVTKCDVDDGSTATAVRALCPHAREAGSGSKADASASAEFDEESTLISNPTLVRTQHTIEASADFVVPSACRRVFIASRKRNVPRWWTGSSPQIAADWLIENNRLYAYSGSGTDWTWTPSGQVVFEAFGKRARWCIDADRIGFEGDADAEAAFHVCAPGHREYSEVATGVSTPV